MDTILMNKAQGVSTEQEKIPASLSPQTIKKHLQQATLEKHSPQQLEKKTQIEDIIILDPKEVARKCYMEFQMLFNRLCELRSALKNKG